MATALVGSSLTAAAPTDYGQWCFEFSSGATLRPGPWRVIDDQMLLFGEPDHAQRLDAAAECLRAFANAAVADIRIDDITGDLIVALDNGAVLQALQLSGAFESWQFLAPGLEVGVMGGGELWAIWPDASAEAPANREG